MHSRTMHFMINLFVRSLMTLTLMAPGSLMSNVGLYTTETDGQMDGHADVCKFDKETLAGWLLYTGSILLDVFVTHLSFIMCLLIYSQLSNKDTKTYVFKRKILAGKLMWVVVQSLWLLCFRVLSGLV